MQRRNGSAQRGRPSGGGNDGAGPGFPESGLLNGLNGVDGEVPDDFPAGDADAPPPPSSIRERQRRRRNAGRARPDLDAILARPDAADDAADEEEAGENASSGPPPPQVFVVFRGAEWADPSGALRESDTIVGIYATEEAARLAVAAIKPEAGVESEGWYQPYPVQS